LENQAKAGEFYNWLGNYLKNELKPKAIVIISAHWQGEGKDGVFGM
jgi:4,5-DOPA dioxygenase extradiol